MNRALVVLLHGVGARGSDVAALGRLWADLLPDADFVAPDAPFAFDQGPGRQWFSLDGITEASRPARVLAARPAFDAMLTDLAAGRDMERLALVGFSQGATMALDAVASGRWPVVACVAFSGRFSVPEPHAPSDRTRLFLVHGTEDRAIPFSESERAHAALAGKVRGVQLLLLPGVGHGFTEEAALQAGRFVAEALGGDTL